METHQPGEQAVDKLIQHLRTCPTCRLARVFPSHEKCATGKRLVRLALEERHDWTEIR